MITRVCALRVVRIELRHGQAKARSNEATHLFHLIDKLFQLMCSTSQEIE